MCNTPFETAEFTVLIISLKNFLHFPDFFQLSLPQSFSKQSLSFERIEALRKLRFCACLVLFIAERFSFSCFSRQFLPPLIGLRPRKFSLIFNIILVIKSTFYVKILHHEKYKPVSLKKSGHVLFRKERARSRLHWQQLRINPANHSAILSIICQTYSQQRTSGLS